MSMVLDNVNIAIGQTVNITSWTMTVPAGTPTNPVLGTALRNAMASQITAELDAGSGAAYVEIRDSASVLVTITTNDPAFGSPSTGTVTAGQSPALSGTATGAGDADNYIAYDSDDTVVFSGTCE
jgi:hypothetical protein